MPIRSGFRARILLVNAKTFHQNYPLDHQLAIKDNECNYSPHGNITSIDDDWSEAGRGWFKADWRRWH